MNIEWKYKIDLVDRSVFDDIGKKRGITIPKELKTLISEGNAATPDKYNFMVGSTERIFGAVLSFNKDDQDVDTVYTALEVIDETNLLPFGIDSFGNYICLDLRVNEVVFWNHEVDAVDSTGKNLKDFLESLY